MVVVVVVVVGLKFGEPYIQKSDFESTLADFTHAIAKVVIIMVVTVRFLI